MKKIEEIKNEISRDLGNENFKELFKNAVRNMPIEKAFLKINDIINEASLIYANKCVKDSLKKASEKAEIITVENMYIENFRKEKRKNRNCTKKPPNSWR